MCCYFKQQRGETDGRKLKMGISSENEKEIAESRNEKAITNIDFAVNEGWPSD